MTSDGIACIAIALGFPGWNITEIGQMAFSGVEGEKMLLLCPGYGALHLRQHCLYGREIGL
jgi:hypothetical protein